jgi:hypothetical protein
MSKKNKNRGNGGGLRIAPPVDAPAPAPEQPTSAEASSDQPIGVSPPELPPDMPQQINGGPTQEQLQEMLMHQIASEVAAGLSMWMPNLSERVRNEHAMAAAREQFSVLEQILPTLVDPNTLAQYPTIMVVIEGKDGKQGNIACPKRIAPNQPIDLMLNSAFTLALLQSPLVRALLRLNGYKYTFQQSNTPAKSVAGPRLIL